MPTNLSLGARRSIGGGFAQNPFGRPLLLDREDGGTTANTGAPAAPAQPTQQGQPAAGTTPAPAQPPQQQRNAPADVEQEYGPLLDAIDQRIEQSLTPVREQNAELRGRLEELSRPIHNAQSLFGRAPAGVSGPLVGAEEDRRGYQMYRAYGLMSRSPNVSREQCKVELAVHEKLERFYVQQGGMSLSGGADGSMLVPYGAALICEFETGLGAQIGELIRQGIRGADPEELQHHIRQSYSSAVRQALSMFDETALGVFTDGTVSGEMFDLVRKREVFSRVGATQLTFPPNGYLKFARATGAATGYWVGENSSITSSEPTTGSLELRAKKAAARVILPNELLRFGTPSVEAFVRADIARVLALLADLAMLEGVGSTNQPKGVINYANIETFTAGTVANDGNTLEPEDPAGMIAAVEENNHDPETDGFAWAMRPKLWKNLRTRRAGALDSSDAADYSVGQWLFDINRAAIQNGEPTMLEGYPVVKSSQISNTRSKGSSSDLSYLLGGIFRHWLIASAGVMEFATSTQGDTVFANDQSAIRAIRHMDAAPRYEDAFVVCDDIDMDLPA